MEGLIGMVWTVCEPAKRPRTREIPAERGEIGRTPCRHGGTRGGKRVAEAI